MPKPRYTREEALQLHLESTRGQWDVMAIVLRTTQRDLSPA